MAVIGQKNGTSSSSLYFGDSSANLAQKKSVDFVGSGHSHGKISASDIFDAYVKGARVGTEFVLGGGQEILGSAVNMSYITRVFNEADLTLVKQKTVIDLLEARVAEAAVISKGLAEKGKAASEEAERLDELASVISTEKEVLEDLIKAETDTLKELTEACTKAKKTGPAGSASACVELAQVGPVKEAVIARSQRDLVLLEARLLEATNAARVQTALVAALEDGRARIEASEVSMGKAAIQKTEELAAAKAIYAQKGGDAIQEINSLAVGLTTIAGIGGKFCGPLTEQETLAIDAAIQILNGGGGEKQV